jgi:transcriptional regulator with XRE-family HTH domain
MEVELTTQKHIANRLGVSQQFISAWVKGQRGLSVDTGLRWSKLLNVGFKRLMTAGKEERKKILGLK